MEIKYLKSKKGSFSETISWAVATLIIVVMLIVYLFVIAFAKSELKSEIEYRKFLSNSFEREFYTFLDEKVLFEDKNISVRELSKKIELKKEGVPIENQFPSKLEEKVLRNKSKEFFNKQVKLINQEKERVSRNSFIMIELFKEEPNKDPFYLTYQEIHQDDITGEKGEERGYAVFKELEQSNYGRSKIECDLRIKDALFMEAFISKDKKITYCFIY